MPTDRPAEAAVSRPETRAWVIARPTDDKPILTMDAQWITMQRGMPGTVIVPLIERGAEARQCADEMEVLVAANRSGRTFIGLDEAEALIAKWRGGERG